MSWFTDGLEEWRKQRGLEKFVLLGHSFGGIIATHYAKAVLAIINLQHQDGPGSLQYRLTQTAGASNWEVILIRYSCVFPG